MESVNNKNKEINCIYCGSTKDITKDHVPPKLLFPNPKPPNLITVPCCRECNQSFQKDDEYFRSIIVTVNGVNEHPDFKKIVSAVKRDFMRPHKQILKKEIQRKTKFIEIKTPAGIYLGNALGYQIEGRIYKVILRIIKGLFYYERGYPIPNNYIINVVSSKEIGNPTPDQINQYIESFKNQKLQTFGNNIFNYKVLFGCGDINVSSWFIAFYKKVSFACMVGPKEVLKRKEV